jgi:dipeptidyl aminopeptidase/acylaminoacyl peptidase
MRGFSSVAVLILAVPALGWAQLTPQRVISYNQVRELQFSPDGKRIALGVEGGPKGTHRTQDIWLSDVSTAQSSRLTEDGESESARWSPDGKWIAYLSSHEGAPQIYAAPSEGGQPIQLSTHAGGIRSFEWSRDGKQIAFLAVDGAGGPAKRRGVAASKDEGEDPRIVKIVSGTDVPTRLWVLDVQSKTERAVTSGTFDVSHMAWRPDGNGFVVTASERPDPEHWSERIYVVGLNDSAPTPLIETKGPLGDLAISPDGSTLAYLASRRGEGEAPSDLYVVPMSGGSPQDLTQSIDRTVEQFQWNDKAHLSVLVQFGFVNHLYEISRDGKATAVAGFDPQAQSFDRSAKDDFAFVRGSASELPEVWVRKGNRGAARQVSRLNEDWKSVTLAKAQIIQYASFDGTQIEGQLLAPPGGGSGKFPTITLIHGGPVGRWADRYDPEGQLLASHGYAVFYPNVRGASSYGEHMIALIRSKARGGQGWATGPLGDVIAGVDALVQRGVADPDRLAMGGWSYGGYMTALALARTNRFKTGVAGAGFYDMVTDLGTEIASYVPGDEWMYGNFFDPETQQLLHQDSPITTIHSLRAPLLIMHGEFDPVDTIGQAYELYRAVKQQGVTTQFVIYPREGHELREEAHVLDRLSRTLDWYEKYLKAAAATTK